MWFDYGAIVLMAASFSLNLQIAHYKTFGDKIDN